MAEARNSYETLARKADERLQKVRARGQQLQLLPDERGVPIEDVAQGTGGRPKGAKNKGSSELRKWLAAQGYRMPEDQLAQIAGLGSDDPAITRAMHQVEEVMAWAFDGVRDKYGVYREPTPEQKISLLTSFLAIMERSAAALLPYGTPKASPDVSVNQTTNVIMPAMPSQPDDPGRSARDITPPAAHRMMPANVRHEIEQKQALSKSENRVSDDEIRTDEASN